MINKWKFTFFLKKHYQHQLLHKSLLLFLLSPEVERLLLRVPWFHLNWVLLNSYFLLLTIVVPRFPKHLFFQIRMNFHIILLLLIGHRPLFLLGKWVNLLFHDYQTWFFKLLIPWQSTWTVSIFRFSLDLFGYFIWRGFNLSLRIIKNLQFPCLVLSSLKNTFFLLHLYTMTHGNKILLFVIINFVRFF